MFREINNAKTTAIYYLALAGTIYAIFHWQWHLATLSLLIHVAVITIFSAVTHRYFCHQAYEANPRLMWWLSLIPVAFTYSSPVAWARLHSAHHAFPDTEKDSHIKGWRGIITTYYRVPSIRFALAGRWFYNPAHEWLQKNSFVVPVIFSTILALISWQALIWFWMVPVFTLHLVSNIHKTFSHSADGALNRWWMEYILPLGGEWIHRPHHDDARRPRFADHWYQLDTGGMLARMLARG